MNNHSAFCVKVLERKMRKSCVVSERRDLRIAQEQIIETAKMTDKQRIQKYADLTANRLLFPI